MATNLDRLFDVFIHSKENYDEDFVFANKNKTIKLNQKQKQQYIRKSIQSFMHEPAAKDGERAIQAFMTTADLTQLTKDVFNVTNQVNNYDLLWQSAFRTIQLRRGQLNWEIATVSNGATFKLIPEGGKIEFKEYTGEKVLADIQKYGMGIGITWETIEGRKLYQFIDQIEQTRAQLFELWGNVHYGLLATAAATNPVAYQGVATDPTLSRDIRTINKGYETIGDATKDSGYGDVANAEMILYASPLLKARLMQAFRATSNDITSGRVAGAAGSVDGQIVEYNVVPKFSWNSNIPANKALLVLPGNKIQNSVYLQELSLSKQDIESLNELRAYWTAFGAVVADNDQTAELSFI